MSDDPVRWKDAEDAPAKVRGLLAHGRAVPPMPKDVRAALLAQLPVAPAPPAPAASSAGVPTAWVIGGVAVVAVAVAALAWNARAPEDPVKPRTPSATPTIVVAPTATAAPAPSEVALPIVSAIPQDAPRSSSRPRPSAAPSTPAPAASASEGTNLAEESVLVARARTNLAPRPAAALDAVEDHARRFPRGELAAEREYLRVSALRRLGRNDEARTRGQRYLTAFPTSPYTSAVRTILTELGEP